jgi:hypothetical protein
MQHVQHLAGMLSKAEFLEGGLYKYSVGLHTTGAEHVLHQNVVWLLSITHMLLQQPADLAEGSGMALHDFMPLPLAPAPAHKSMPARRVPRVCLSANYTP